MKKAFLLLIIITFTVLQAQLVIDTLWTKTFGRSEQDYGGYCVQQTTDGGYIITGQTHSFGNDQGSGLWLIKTDPDGNTVPYSK